MVEENIPIKDDSGDLDGYIIDTKTEKNLIKTLLNRTLERALDPPLPPPPSPLEQAFQTAQLQIGQKFAENLISGLGGNTSAKSSIWLDILNTGAAQSFAGSIGAKLPEAMQALGNVFGQKKAGEIVDKATEAYSQAQQKNQQIEQQNQQTAILNLDSNNPDHLKQYASAMGMSELIAKDVLIAHQKDILLQRKSQQTQPTQSQQSEQEQALLIMIEEMKSMKAEIQRLKGENQEKMNATVNDGSDKWSDEDSPMPPFNTERNVKLFNQPVKVDVDDIQGNSNPFFKETPKSVLVEEKDEKGKSTFRMSDEPKKVEVTHQKVNVVEMKKEESSDVEETQIKEKDEPETEVPPEEIKETVEEKEEPNKETEKVNEVNPKIRKILRKKE